MLLKIQLPATVDLLIDSDDDTIVGLEMHGPHPYNEEDISCLLDRDALQRDLYAWLHDLRRDEADTAATLRASTEDRSAA